MFNGRLVKRQWGWYLTILDRKHFKVKLLRFSSLFQMSNQYHQLREELWLFLTGRDEGTYRHIPKNRLHSYMPDKPTWVLEIQYGERCDEEDIVRL